MVGQRTVLLLNSVLVLELYLPTGVSELGVGGGTGQQGGITG